MGYHWPARRPAKMKYNSVRTNGFASKLEAAVYDVLFFMEKAGQITDIRCQESVFLTDAKVQVKIDFSYETTGCRPNRRIYVEAKGIETDRWLIVKKLWRHYGPGPLEIWKGSYDRPRLDESIEPCEKKGYLK